MDNNSKVKKDPYLPVDCDFCDELALLSDRKKFVKLFFFNGPETIDVVTGVVTDIATRNREEFCIIGGREVRLDKIVTIDGKPGPAYEQYDAFANACLNCNLGYS